MSGVVANARSLYCRGGGPGVMATLSRSAVGESGCWPFRPIGSSHRLSLAEGTFPTARSCGVTIPPSVAAGHQFEVGSSDPVVEIGASA